MKCEKCGKEPKHQKLLKVGATGQKVCNKCYNQYSILEQLGLPELKTILKEQ
jgi:ribosome-binding protein aMBF1 (putative translation factor)